MPPSPQQLLRLAHEKEALAANFEAQAKRLDLVFADIPASPAESNGYWRGPAAERFVAHARTLRRGIEELMESCRMTAQNLRRHAAQLRRQAAQETGGG